MTKSEKRERKRHKLKHGMQESGRSVKYLVRLATDRSKKLRKGREDALPGEAKKKERNKKNRANQKLALFHL